MPQSQSTRWGAVALLMTVLLTAAFAARPVHIRHSGVSDLIATIAARSCTGNCIICQLGPRHMFLDQVNIGDMDLIGYHECFEVEGYPNCSVHNCGFEGSEGFENDLALLEAQLRAATGFELARLAVDNGRLRINPERRAVQVLGCNDEIVLSINLSAAQQAVLRAPFSI